MLKCRLAEGGESMCNKQLELSAEEKLTILFLLDNEIQNKKESLQCYQNYTDAELDEKRVVGDSIYTKRELKEYLEENLEHTESLYTKIKKETL